jgi:hypothetical protein
MVAVKEAVKLSLENLNDLFPGETMPGLRLEEIARSEDDRNWDVTVSYLNPDFDREVAGREKGNNGLKYFLDEKKNVPMRLYKTVSINVEDGSLVAIRNDWDVFNT